MYVYVYTHTYIYVSTQNQRNRRVAYRTRYQNRPQNLLSRLVAQSSQRPRYYSFLLASLSFSFINFFYFFGFFFFLIFSSIAFLFFPSFPSSFFESTLRYFLPYIVPSSPRVLRFLLLSPSFSLLLFSSVLFHFLPRNLLQELSIPFPPSPTPLLLAFPCPSPLSATHNPLIAKGTAFTASISFSFIFPPHHFSPPSFLNLPFATFYPVQSPRRHGYRLFLSSSPIIFYFFLFFFLSFSHNLPHTSAKDNFLFFFWHFSCSYSFPPCYPLSTAQSPQHQL